MNEENLKFLASLKLNLQLTCMQFDALQYSLSEEQLKVMNQHYSKICTEVSKDQEQK